eukprot:12933004-Prorocentrum_lima.AAC.1
MLPAVRGHGAKGSSSTRGEGCHGPNAGESGANQAAAIPMRRIVILGASNDATATSCGSSTGIVGNCRCSS